MQVNADVSVDKATAAIGGLSLLKRPVNSAAKCWLSAADPPLPHNINLPPFCKLCTQA